MEEIREDKIQEYKQDRHSKGLHSIPCHKERDKDGIQDEDISEGSFMDRYCFNITDDHNSLAKIEKAYIDLRLLHRLSEKRNFATI